MKMVSYMMLWKPLHSWNSEISYRNLSVNSFECRTSVASIQRAIQSSTTNTLAATNRWPRSLTRFFTLPKLYHMASEVISKWHLLNQSLMFRSHSNWYPKNLIEKSKLSSHLSSEHCLWPQKRQRRTKEADWARITTMTPGQIWSRVTRPCKELAAPKIRWISLLKRVRPMPPGQLVCRPQISIRWPKSRNNRPRKSWSRAMTF